MFRKYVFVFLLCIGGWGYLSLPFVSCSSPPEPGEGDGGPPIKPRPDIPPDIVIEPEPYRKRTGSWVIGPRTLAPRSIASQMRAITTDSKGNIIIAGLIDEKFDRRHPKIFVAKVGPDSIPLWIYQAPATQEESNSRALDVECDGNDNIYVTGAFTGKFSFGASTLHTPPGPPNLLGTYHPIVLKFSSTGKQLWVARIQGEDNGYHYRLTVTSQGSIYVGGQIPASAQFDGVSFKPQDPFNTLFLAKLSPEGKWEWARNLNPGTGYSGSVVELTSDPKENLYLSGTYRKEIQFGTTTLTSTNNENNEDIFIAKFRSDGTFLWAVSAGGEGIEYLEDLLVDQAGNAYISGHIQTAMRFGSHSIPASAKDSKFMAKVSSQGQFAWVLHGGKFAGEKSNVRKYELLGFGLHPTSKAIVMTGSVNDGPSKFGNILYQPPTSPGYPSVFVAQIDPQGQWLSVKHLGRAERVLYGRTAFAPGDVLYMVGTFLEGAIFNGTWLYQNPSSSSHFGIESSTFLWKVTK